MKIVLDENYNKAVEFVIDTGKTSASSLQRYFRIGYFRASRLIDQMEEMGVIGKENGSKPREILARN